MEHYYTKNPKGEYIEHKITTVIMGIKMEFITADGVFSKSNIDYGTMTLISALYSRHKNIGKLLDLGCGYGIIGISAALITGAESTMCDINQRAVLFAEKNAELNGVSADIKSCDGYGDMDSKFDIIAANPPIRAGKKVYYPWIENAIDYLNDDGELWVVAQKKQGAASIKKLMENTFNNCEIIDKDKQYHILMARRKDDRNI